MRRTGRQSGGTWAIGLFGWLVLVAQTSPLHAGLYYSAEKYAPLPSRWQGFLLDHHALRTIAQERPADGFVSPLRQEYLRAADHFRQLSRQRPLTAEESADYGAVLLRLGRTTEALSVLQSAARRWPQHFSLQANLGTAWQMLGELDRAADVLQEALSLAPSVWRRYEEYHLRLVQSRRREAKAPVAAADDLFGVRFDGPAGLWPESRRSRLPDDAIAIVQQLALWFPRDARLLWLAAELANAVGETAVAAAMLDGCVTEFGFSPPLLRERRRLFRAAMDHLRDHNQHRSVFRTRSARPLIQAFDERLLPPPRHDGPTPIPWPLLQASVIQADGSVRFPEYLNRLDGRGVSLHGFLQPLGDDPQPQDFLLVPYPIGCWFCESPGPTSMVYIRLAPGRQVEKRRELILVAGRLRLNRDNPETFLFILEDAVVALPQ